MSETTQLTEYVLKSGNGWLWGVSNNHAQPGKKLTIIDGTVVLCILALDEAFPDRPIIRDGEEDIEPGCVLNVVFIRELRIQTDGDDLNIRWY